MAVNSHFEM